MNKILVSLAAVIILWFLCLYFIKNIRYDRYYISNTQNYFSLGIWINSSNLSII